MIEIEYIYRTSGIDHYSILFLTITMLIAVDTAYDVADRGLVSEPQAMQACSVPHSIYLPSAASQIIWIRSDQAVIRYASAASTWIRAPQWHMRPDMGIVESYNVRLYIHAWTRS